MSVSVDNDFARFGSKSYAINKITSVEIREVQEKGNGCAIAACGVIAAISAFSGLGALIAAPKDAFTYLVIAAVFCFITYTLAKKGRKITYHLFLITSASEQQAYVTSSRDDVFNLRDQVEAAMLHHSRGLNARS